MIDLIISIIWVFISMLFILGLIKLCYIILISIINLEHLPVDLIIIYYFGVYSNYFYKNIVEIDDVLYAQNISIY